MEILKETKSFYEKLYKKREIIDEYSVHEKLEKIDCPKLNNEELNTLEGPLTDTEVLNFLKKQKMTKVLALMVSQVSFLNFFGKT